MPLALTTCTFIIWPQRKAFIIAVIIVGRINNYIQLQLNATATTQTTMARKRTRNTRHKKSNNNNSSALILAATTTIMTATTTATATAAVAAAATTTATRAAAFQLNDKNAKEVTTTMRAVKRRPSNKFVQHVLNGFEYVSVNPATLPKMQNDDMTAATTGRKRCVNCGQQQPYLVLDLRADMHMRHILLKIFQKTLAETEHVLQAMCANCDINIRLQQDKILLERMRNDRRKSRSDATSHDGSSIKQKSQQNTFDGEHVENWRNGATPLMNGHSCPSSPHSSPLSGDETHTHTVKQHKQRQQQQRAKSVINAIVESEIAATTTITATPKTKNKVNKMTRSNAENPRTRRYTHIGYRDKSCDRIPPDQPGVRMTRSRTQSRYYESPLALETEIDVANDFLEMWSTSPTESVQEFLTNDGFWYDNYDFYESDNENAIERRTTRAVKSRMRLNKNKREYRLFRKTIQEIERTRRRNRWKYRAQRGFEHFQFVTDKTLIEQHRRNLTNFRAKFHHTLTHFPTDDELRDDAKKLQINTFRDYDIYLFERLKEQAHMGIFRCSVPDCSYLTRKIEYLAAHDYAAHTTNGTYTCKKCGDQFSKMYFLYYHYFMLEKDEYYFCYLCEQVFTFIVDYQRHLRAHELNTNYACATCDLQFASVHDLNAHCNERQHNMYGLEQQQQQQQRQRLSWRIRKRPRIHIQEQFNFIAPATQTTTTKTTHTYAVYTLNLNAPLAVVDVGSAAGISNNLNCTLLLESKMPLQLAYKIGRLNYSDCMSPKRLMREKLCESKCKEALNRQKYIKRRRKFGNLLRKLQQKERVSSRNSKGTRRRRRAKSRLKVWNDMTATT